MKQIEVTILGQGYILGCPEGGEALLATAVAAVDREMSAIRDGGKVKARERIAHWRLANAEFAGQAARRQFIVRGDVTSDDTLTQFCVNGGV